MKIGKLFLTAVTFCSVASLQAQSGTQIVAHRGYWKTEGSAQKFHRFARKGDRNRVPGLGNRFDSDDRRRARVASRRCDRRQAGGCEHLCRNQGRQAVQRRIPCRRSTPFWLSPGSRKAPSRSSRSSPIRPSRRRMRPSLPRWTPVRRAGMNQTGRVYLVFEEHLRAVDSERPQRNQGGYLGGDCRPGSSPSGDIPDSIIISARCGLMRSGSTKRGSLASRSMSGLSMTRDR